jgi:bacteriocin-like protein
VEFEISEKELNKISEEELNKVSGGGPMFHRPKGLSCSGPLSKREWSLLRLDVAKGASTGGRVLSVFDPRCPSLNPAVS